MKISSRNIGFKFLLAFFFLVFLVQYILDTTGIGDFRMPVILDIFLFLSFYVSYLRIYRKHNLLCFELMALPVAFLGLFFDDIIYPFSPELSNFFSIGDEFIKMKSEDIQMSAFFALLLGGAVGNDCRKKGYTKIERNSPYVNYGLFIYILSGLLLLLIIYDYAIGVFSSWFYYSNANVMDVEDRNQGLGHLTCLLLAATGVEIVRLREKGVSNMQTFLKKSNKLFMSEWLGISALLYLSGNRNEMLLILLPLIVGYTVCIKRISNKVLIILGMTGVVFMAIAGMTRQEEVSLSGSQLGILAFTRDFADLGYNTDYLIRYTDKNGAIYFQGLLGMLLSGIPYLGNAILNTIKYETVEASATLTTESVESTSGLGTSLIGDLYYTAGFAWVIFYMFLLGYVMSRLYHADRWLNIYWLIFYSYMVANSVYYIRSSWAFPITVIEYASIIIFIGNIVFKKNKKNSCYK